MDKAWGGHRREFRKVLELDGTGILVDGHPSMYDRLTDRVLENSEIEAVKMECFRRGIKVPPKPKGSTNKAHKETLWDKVKEWQRSRYHDELLKKHCEAYPREGVPLALTIEEAKAIKWFEMCVGTLEYECRRRGILLDDDGYSVLALARALLLHYRVSENEVERLVAAWHGADLPGDDLFSSLLSNLSDSEDEDGESDSDDVSLLLGPVGYAGMGLVVCVVFGVVVWVWLKKRKRSASVLPSTSALPSTTVLATFSKKGGWSSSSDGSSRSSTASSGASDV